MKTTSLFLMVSLCISSIAWPINRYFWYPETLRIPPGENFAWTLKFESDSSLYGYGFSGVIVDDTCLAGNPTGDTLIFDWTGSAGDVFECGFVGPEYFPNENRWGGVAFRYEDPCIDPGTWIAVTVHGQVALDAPYGLYEWQLPASGFPVDFTSCPGNVTFPVSTVSGWLEVTTEFIRADANADMDVLMSDAIYTLQYLYAEGDPPPCMDAADSNDDGEILMNDAIYTLRYLYLEDPPPPAPFPDCGSDPTVDALGCDAHPCMSGGYKMTTGDRIK